MPSDSHDATDDRTDPATDDRTDATTDDRTDPATDDRADSTTDDRTDPATDDRTDATTDDPTAPASILGGPDDRAVRLRVTFGADPVSDDQRRRLPDDPVLRRGVAVGGRDLDRVADAIGGDKPLSVVTGFGPSGPFHLGHAMQFYFARRLQAATDARVIVPVSDDEKAFTRDQTLTDADPHLRANLRDLLAVDFDPERTTVLVDTVDADLLYPAAVDLARELTPATVAAVYGDPDNVGAAFYPAMQAAHLLLPQLLDGPHATLVPVGVDQDPHVRVARDLAGKAHRNAEKPATVLTRYLPAMSGPDAEMSSSGDDLVALDDDPETVRRKLADAHSGGRVDVDTHREHGGDPTADVAMRLLAFGFDAGADLVAGTDPGDDELRRLAAAYRAGDLLTGELKSLVAERLNAFLRAHRERRPDADLASLRAALAPYRPDAATRQRLLRAPLDDDGRESDPLAP